MRELQNKMNDFKIRVSKNIGECSIECFGEPGTEFEVLDGYFYDLQSNKWRITDNLPFENIDGVNEYFSGEDTFKTVFELVVELHNKLNDFKTCELVEELKNREGVQVHLAVPDEDFSVEIKNPAIVLVVID